MSTIHFFVAVNSHPCID